MDSPCLVVCTRSIDLFHQVEWSPVQVRSASGKCEICFEDIRALDTCLHHQDCAVLSDTSLLFHRDSYHQQPREAFASCCHKYRDRYRTMSISAGDKVHRALQTITQGQAQIG